jgi:hypothetical protein
MRLPHKDIQSINEAYQGSVLNENRSDVLYFSPTPGRINKYRVGDEFYIRGLKGIDSGTIISINGSTGEINMTDDGEGWTVTVDELNDAAGIRLFYIRPDNAGERPPVHGPN